MKWYHGTTEELMRSIRAHGLRKGTFVSPELAVARSFASLRSQWNGFRPVVLTGVADTSKTKLDRSGQAEAVLLADCRAVEIVHCDFASDPIDPLPAYMRTAATRIFTAHKARTFNRDIRYPVTRDEKNRRLCRWCQKPVAKGRQSYCSDQCQIEVDIRTSANAARRHVHDRDKGVCRSCGLDTDKLCRILYYANESSAGHKYRKIHWSRIRLHWPIDPTVQTILLVLGFNALSNQHYWEADHVVELSDGGDGGLANLQTLCIPCHKRKTAANAGRRASARRDSRRPLLALAENAA